MKVVHFIHSIDKTAGGTTAYMQLLSSELKNLVDLKIATGKTENTVLFDEQIITLFRFSMKRWFSLQKEFYNFLKQEKPDIVHINGIWNIENYLFQSIAIKLGIKVILSPHGMLEPYIMQRNSLKKKIALLLYQHKSIKNASFIHATANEELQNIKKLGYKQPSIIIPNGIDISEVFVKKENSYSKIKELLFLSRIHPKKGIEILIEAISKIQDKNIHVTIAGEGEAHYIESLMIMIKHYDVAKQISFIGGVYGNNKWELYNKCDLFVLPTYSENFGIVIAEALATGLPVITTKGTPWCELEEKNCGWWIDLNVENVQKAIEQALNKTATELFEMGQRGRQLICENYDIKSIAHKMYSFYSSIVTSQK